MKFKTKPIWKSNQWILKSLSFILFFLFSYQLSMAQCTVASGTISTSSNTTLCVGDGVADLVDVSVSGNTGTSGWIITDLDGVILGLPPASPFDFDGAGLGTCVIWHISYDGAVTGMNTGDRIALMTGCFDLSNPIPVFRTVADGGSIATTDGLTEITICAGDGVPDPFDVVVSDAVGDNSAWVITDADLNILGLPAAPPFDLEGAGEGVCLVWYLSYNGTIDGLDMGANAEDLEGCFDLSNPITVTRNGVDGGNINISGGGDAITICAGDGVSDVFDVDLTGNVGENSGWVITDADLNILGLPAAPPFDLEGAGEGVCLVWHISYYGDLVGAMVGANAADLDGCYDLSNPITVTREGVDGGSIATTDGLTDITICAGDGMPDPFDVVVSDAVGDNSAWVITDADLNILGLPAAPPFDLEGAGEGVCLVWYLRYNGDITGLSAGANAGDLEGCFDLSNPITVARNGVDGGNINITGGGDEITICAGDGVSDAFDVDLTGNVGENSGWVITDADLNILGLPAAPPFDLEGAGSGVCLVWHISYHGNLTGAMVGNNAADLEGCYDLSNPIKVTREGVDGGSIATTDGLTDLTICAGDGMPDPFDVVVSDADGDNSAWVITDADLNILGLPAAPPFDLEGAGEGVCLVWYLRYNGTIDGLSMGANAGDLDGCYDLSNPITVTRNGVDGGSINIVEGSDAVTICAGDGVSDAFDVDLTGNVGENSGWVITDADLNILGLPAAPPFDLEGAGSGVCLVWHISYHGDLTGAMVGNNAADLEGCYDLSNPITVTREGVDGGYLTTTDGQTEITICAGDGISDAFDVTLTDVDGDNSAWVITDEDLNILGLPASPPFDLEGAGEGTCLIWHLSYNGTLTGAAVGENAADLEGCYDLSNPITVIRLTGDDCPQGCQAPTTFSYVHIWGNRAIVDWNDVPDAWFYLIRYREVGTSNWRYRFALNSIRTLSGINPNNTYEYQIITYCYTDGYSSWSDLQFIDPFTPIRAANNSNQDLEQVDFQKEESPTELILYPNPVQDQLNIIHPFESDKIHVQVQSVQGKIVFDQTLRADSENVNISLAGLPPGQYVLSTRSEKEIVSKVFIKQ